MLEPAGRRYNGAVMNETAAPPAAEPVYDCPYCDGQLVPLPDHPDLACNVCGRRFDAEMFMPTKTPKTPLWKGTTT